MVWYLRHMTSERKIRLAAVSACMQVEHLLIDERSRTALVVAEHDYLNRPKLEEAYKAANEVAQELLSLHPPNNSLALAQAIAAETAASCAYPQEAWAGASCVMWRVCLAVKRAARGTGAAGRPAAKRARSRNCALLRCIFGNPDRPLHIKAFWKGGTIEKLALAASTSAGGLLDAAHLGVLADCLEENSCTDAAILGHLRGPGIHAKGCHVIDALLGEG
jgi:hypothetical protein